MNRIIVFGAAILLLSAFGRVGMAAEGYEMLFKGTKSKLSKQEKHQVFKDLGFRLSKNKKVIVDDTCGEVSPSVEIVDLNGDGVEEIIVNWGNA